MPYWAWPRGTSLTEALLVKERAASLGVRNVTAHALAMMRAGNSPLGQNGALKLCSTHSLGSRSVRDLGRCRGCPGYLLPGQLLSRVGGVRGQGRGWGGGASRPAQASLLSHLPHCSFLASQGPVEGAGCFPWGRGKNSYQYWNERHDSYLCENASLKIKIKSRKAIYPLS